MDAIGVRRRHKLKEPIHYSFHECAVCGAKRKSNTYKPWAYGYGKWSNGQWCPGPAAVEP